MIKIVADENIPYLKSVLEPYCEMVYLRGKDIKAVDIAYADAMIVRTRTRCDEALLRGSKVGYIATATIGTDHIDKEYCACEGIEVYSAAGCNAGGVLQWVSAALVRLCRYRSRSPGEMTLGVIGVGNVGSLVARYSRMWSFNVLMSDPPREIAENLGRADGFVSVEEIYERSDVISFHVPLTVSGGFATAAMVGKGELGRMKQGVALLNASRGGIIDEWALLEAVLKKNVLACIDTWSGEPEINEELLRAAFIATPHVAGYSAQGKANATSMVVGDLARRFALPIKGWYPKEVNPVRRGIINWGELLAHMDSYYDIAAETNVLKGAQREFEAMRREYRYRQEFF